MVAQASQVREEGGNPISTLVVVISQGRITATREVKVWSLKKGLILWFYFLWCVLFRFIMCFVFRSVGVLMCVLLCLELYFRIDGCNVLYC